MQNNCIFAEQNRKLCARSSMDRIKDSGSFDWGSTPHRITFQVLGDLQIAMLNG